MSVYGGRLTLGLRTLGTQCITNGVHEGAIHRSVQDGANRVRNVFRARYHTARKAESPEQETDLMAVE
jgi:hypothetical protein